MGQAETRRWQRYMSPLRAAQGTACKFVDVKSSPAHRFSLPRHFRPTLRSPWAWCAFALALFTALLNSVPPFRDIHYEFSAASALVLSLLPCGIIALRRRSEESVPLERDITRVLLLSLVPLLVAVLALPFRSDVCIGDGPLWYLLLAPPAALISLSLARLAEAVAPHRRWLRSLLVLLLWTGSLARGAWEALTGPHIFLYCWQVGFFPGGSWDPSIPVSDRLIYYRATHLLIAAGVLMVAELWRRRATATTRRPHSIPLVTTTLLLAAIVPLLLGLRVRLGLTSTDAWVEDQLGDVIRTRWSTVVTNRAAVDSLSLHTILMEIDHDVEEYARVLDTRPETFAPVRIVLYPSAAERGRLVGSVGVAYTKPWRGEMHIVAQQRGVLRHELAHLAMAPFGNLLGITLAQGMLEGSAEGLAGEWGTLSLEEYAVAMRQYGTAPNPASIMTIGGFTGHNTSASYVTAGAFCRWLIERYGSDKFTRVFGSGEFDEIYGTPLDSLGVQYTRRLDSLARSRFTLRSETVRYLFGGGGFFQQRCLRALGALNAQADAALAAGRPERAIELAHRAMELGGSGSTQTTVVRALAALRRYNEVEDSLRRYASDTSARWTVPLAVELGDALWFQGAPDAALPLYDTTATRALSPALTARALARWTSINSSDPAVRSRMLGYFTGTMSTARRVALLGDLAAHTDDTATGTALRLLRAQLLVNEAPVATIQHLLDDGTLHRASGIATSFSHPRQVGLLLKTLLTELAPAALLHDRLSPSTERAWKVVRPALLETPAVRHLDALAD